MIRIEDQFMGEGGARLFWQRHQPDGKGFKAHVTLLHGYGEHTGRYGLVFERLVNAGYVVSGYDQRGYGRSEGRRGHVDRWEQYRGDLWLFVQRMRRDFPELKHFLFGHSMGGLMSLDFLGHHQELLDGAIVSGPALGEPEVPKWMLPVSEALSQVWPTFTLDTGRYPERLSRDPEAVRIYNLDPLCHSLGTARFGAEFQAAQRRVKAAGRSVSLPIFVYQGTADMVVPVADTQRYFETIGSEDKTLKLYEGGYHEPHHDLNKEEAVGDVVAWLDAHV